MAIKRFLPIGALCGLLLVGGFGIVKAQVTPTAPERGGGRATQTAPVDATPVTTAPVDTATTTSISALGSVEANTVATLQFQTNGTVKGVYVQVGDTVQAGEVLADLKDTDAWNTYQQAVLNLESANIAKQQLLEPPSEADLRAARANVASAQAAYSATANQTSEAQINAAQMKVDQAEAQLQALKDARAHMGGTDAQITLQEAQIGAASFNAEIARLQLQELQTPNSAGLWSAGIRIQQAQLQLEALSALPTQAQLDNAQLAIDRAQNSLLDAENALKKVQLVAPISGTITALNIAAGDSVAAVTAAMVISDLSSLHMTVPINELDIASVNEGMAATISLDALTDLVIAGMVEHVGWLSSTSSDGIVTYKVQVVLQTADTRVRIGMTGEVTIEIGSASS